MNSRRSLIILICILAVAVVAVGYLLFRYIENLNRRPVYESKELTAPRDQQRAVEQNPVSVDILPYGKDSKIVSSAYVVYSLRAKVNTINKNTNGNYDVEVLSLDGSEKRVFSVPPQGAFYSSPLAKEISGDEVKPGDDVSITASYKLSDLDTVEIGRFMILNK